MTTRSKQSLVRAGWPVLIVFAIIAYGAAPAVESRLLEKRWFRDFYGATPFKSVNVNYQIIDSRGLILGGDFIKVRCTYSELSAYVNFPDRPSERVAVDTSVEDNARASGDRPSHPLAQSWGPWLLVYDSALKKPDGYTIYGHHRSCPSNPENQVNEFASGPWKALENAN